MDERASSYLPVVCDEVIIDNEKLTLKKIAEFSHKGLILLGQERWLVQTPNFFEYEIYDRGRKIRKFEGFSGDGESHHSVDEGAKVERVCENGETLYRLVDTDGTVLVETPYRLLPFRGSYSKVQKRVLFLQHGVGVLSFDGEILVEPKYHRIYSISGDLMGARKEEGTPDILLTEDGTELMTGKVFFTEGNLVVTYDEEFRATVYEYNKK